MSVRQHTESEEFAASDARGGECAGKSRLWSYASYVGCRTYADLLLSYALTARTGSVHVGRLEVSLMHEQDYALMLDTVYRAWGLCEATFLLTADRVLEGELGLDAQLEQCRANCDRALLDLSTLRSQAADVSARVATSTSTTTPVRTSTPSPARLLLTFINRAREFAAAEPGAIDAAI